MFRIRRKISLTSSMCDALEFLRMAMEVELGTKVQFSNLDIDPLRHDDDSARTIEVTGSYHTPLIPFALGCQYHHFSATVNLVPDGTIVRRPIKAQLYFGDTDYHVIWQKRGTVVVALVASEWVLRHDFRVGTGYHSDERWTEPICPETHNKDQG
jgi:hypothetical protein